MTSNFLRKLYTFVHAALYLALGLAVKILYARVPKGLNALIDYRLQVLINSHACVYSAFRVA